MRNAWYVIMFSDDLRKDQSYQAKLFGDPLVIFRDHMGVATCFLDSCPHRMVPLSLGKVCRGTIECAHHGWRYDGSGRCVHIPLLPEKQQIPKTARAHTYPTIERGGAVWVWPGDPREADASLIRLPTDLPGRLTHAHSMAVLFPTRYDLLIEHVLDMPHVFGSHDSTLLKYLPRPRAGGVPEFFNVDDHGDELTLNLRDPSRPDAEPVLIRIFHPCHLSIDVPLPWGRYYKFMFFHTPIDEAQTRGVAFQYRDFLTAPVIKQGFNWAFASMVHRTIRDDLSVFSGQMENVSKRAISTTSYYFDALMTKYHKWQRRREDEHMWFEGFDHAIARYDRKTDAADRPPAR